MWESCGLLSHTNMHSPQLHVEFPCHHLALDHSTNFYFRWKWRHLYNRCKCLSPQKLHKCEQVLIHTSLMHLTNYQISRGGGGGGLGHKVHVFSAMNWPVPIVPCIGRPVASNKNLIEDRRPPILIYLSFI